MSTQPGRQNHPLKFKDRLYKLFFWKQGGEVNKRKGNNPKGERGSLADSCFPLSKSVSVCKEGQQGYQQQQQVSNRGGPQSSGKKSSVGQVSSWDNSQEITHRDNCESIVSQGNSAATANTNCAEQLSGSRATRTLQHLQYGTEKQRQTALEQMFRLIKQDDSAAYKFARLGAIPTLVQLLVGGSSSAQTYASYSLSCMTGLESFRLEMVRAGVIEALIDLLERENGKPVVKKGAMRAISKLVRGDKEAKLIVNKGGLTAISGLLESSELSIIKRSLRALFFIAADKPELQEKILVTTDIMPYIIQYLNSDNLDIQAEAADLLKTLTEHPLADEQILQSEGLETLQSVARSNTHPKTRQCAVLALQRLAQRDHMKQQILDTGGEELLSQSIDNDADYDSFLYVVSEGDPYTKVQAAQAVVELVSDDPRYSRELAAHGAISPLLQLLRDGEEQQSKHAASSALANLCQDDHIKTQILQAGAIPDFVRAVHECSCEYMEGPVLGLYQMSSLTGATQEMMAAGATDAFAWALFKGTNKVQLLACKGLYKFVSHQKSIPDSLIQQEYHSQIIHQFWKVQSNVQVLILQLLHKLATMEYDYQLSIFEAGLVPVLEYCKSCDGELASTGKKMCDMLSSFEGEVAAETETQQQIGTMLQEMREDIQVSVPIEAAFRMVPRSLFVPSHLQGLAYNKVDISFPEHDTNISNPCLDAMCLNALDLQSGHAFLDVGCGSAFFTCLASYMVGEKGASVGIDVDQDTCFTASNYVDLLRQHWPQQKWMPTIQVEDVCLAMDSCEQYDRVHVGAACPKDWLTELVRLLLPGGKMVVPCDKKLLLITKEGGVENAQVVASIECGVLQLPSYRRLNQQMPQKPRFKLQLPVQSSQGDIVGGRTEIPKSPRNDSANCGDDSGDYQSASSQLRKSSNAPKIPVLQPPLSPSKQKSKPQIQLREAPSIGARTPRSERPEDFSYQRWKESQTNQDWLLSYKDIDICRNKAGKRQRLGEGGFGVVYKAVMNKVDEVAVKVVKTDAPKTKELDLFKKEVQILTGLRHKNIVQFYGACLEVGSLFFVTELMKGGDLYNALRSHPDMMQWDKLGKKVALDIALGINYLHTRKPPMIHRDLKSPNVLLSEEGVAKIADVGMVRSQVKDLVTAQPIMTPLWAAPEVVRHERASLKADMWSYGILIWELVSGEDITEFQPLAFSRTAKINNKKGKIMCLPSKTPSVAQKIYEECTRIRPEDRPSASKIVEWLRREIR